MKKKFYILFLTMAFVMSIAGAGWGVETYYLSFLDENESEITELVPTSVYPYDHQNEQEAYMFSGRNYRAVYTLPDYKVVFENEDSEEKEELSKDQYSITWDVRPYENSPALDWLFWEINSNDELILTGILPEYDEDDSNNNRYSPVLLADAKVSGVNVAESLVSLQEIDVAQDYSKAITSKDEDFEDFVTTDKNQLENADSKYSVNVQLPKYLRKNEGYTIGYENYDIINLPDWLSYDVTEAHVDESENVVVTKIKIYFKKETDVEEGTEATVTIPVVAVNDDYYSLYTDYTDENNNYSYATLQWNVTYTENAPFKFLTSTDQTFSLEPGEASSYTFSYTGSKPTGRTISSTEIFTNNVDVKISEITDNSITIRVTAKPTAKAGTYTATLKFTNDNKKFDTAKITVEVKASATPTTPTNLASNDEKPEPEPDPEHDPELDPENIETKSEDVKPVPENPISFHEIESGDKPVSNDERPVPTPTPSRTSRDIQPGNNNNNNNTNNNISSNGQRIVGVSATPKQSTMNINNATIKDNVATALGIDFGDNEGIKTIKNQGKSRTIEDENVKNQISQISGSEDVKVLVLPLFEFESGVTVFALNYSDFENANIVSGEPIRIHPTPQPESASELSSSIYASANDNFKLLDSSGKEINVLPSDSNEEINVAAYVNSSQIYSILVYSGGNSAETVSVTITSDDITPSALGPSGAGCDTGINFATLLIVVAGFIFRKKLR